MDTELPKKKTKSNHELIKIHCDYEQLKVVQCILHFVFSTHFFHRVCYKWCTWTTHEVNCVPRLAITKQNKNRNRIDTSLITIQKAHGETHWKNVYAIRNPDRQSPKANEDLQLHNVVQLDKFAYLRIHVRWWEIYWVERLIWLRSEFIHFVLLSIDRRKITLDFEWKWIGTCYKELLDQTKGWKCIQFGYNQRFNGIFELFSNSEMNWKFSSTESTNFIVPVHMIFAYIYHNAHFQIMYVLPKYAMHMGKRNKNNK